jgi:outer membrane receptor protein involved in Fe transport
VSETSLGAYYQNELEWTDHLRTQIGLRADTYRFRVKSDDPVNSGTDHASVASPKFGVAVGPWRGTELYANAGYGFHSNDARGVTIVEDPVTHEGADRVTPLVRARGAELGVRTVAIPHVQSTAAVWTLGLDSELVFSGDAGTTEAGRPSRRTGVEWTNYVSPTSWLTFDADFAFSKARFTDVDPVGDRIPGSAGTIISVGGAVQEWHGVFGALRLRYFGPRTLIEDHSARSKSTSLLNGNIGFRLKRDLRFAVDVFNLLNSDASDVDYYYTSRLPGEPAEGVTDVHTHPITGRTARFSVLVGL